MNEIDQIQKRNTHNSDILPHPVTHFGTTATSPLSRHLHHRRHLPATSSRHREPARSSGPATRCRRRLPQHDLMFEVTSRCETECTYIPCVLSGYKLIRTQQVAISKPNPIGEDTTANHLRPTTTRTQRHFFKPHPVSKHDLPHSHTLSQHPPPLSPLPAQLPRSTITPTTPQRKRDVNVWVCFVL
jgi:hypothetical protein